MLVTNIQKMLGYKWTATGDLYVSRNQNLKQIKRL